VEFLQRITVTQHGDWYVGWGTLALLNAGLAQAKNRSGLIWFLLSLLFGPAFFDKRSVFPDV
jgi:hypothetical protein